MATITDAAVQLTVSVFPSRPLQEFIVTTRPYASVSEDVLREFLRDSISGDYLGVSYLFQTQRRLSAVVFATPTRVLYITGLKKGQRKQSQLLERFICCNDRLRLFGADTDILAYGLYTDAGMFMSNGLDLMSLDLGDPDANCLQGHSFVLGSVFGPPPWVAIRNVFLTQSSGNREAKALVRAREYAVAAQQHRLGALLACAPRISTKVMDVKTLAIMAKIHRDTARLDAMKPTIQKNDVEKAATVTEKGLEVLCSRYKTRIRATGQIRLLRASNGKTIGACVRAVNGKTATFETQGAPPTSLKSVVTIGKDPLTFAEQNKTDILLHVLQDRLSFKGNAVFTAIWGGGLAIRPRHQIALPATVTVPLNASQDAAVRAVLAEPQRNGVLVQLILGPPGTGKTSTITAIVQGLRATRQPVWIVANSNVAVKNIARKLAQCGFLEFKLLVSHEFHFDWHEHLYQRLQLNLIRSEMFAKLDLLEVERLVSGCGVILCTISMLSNASMIDAGFTQVVPIVNLLVDEASQIDVGDYLSVAETFSRTLRRLAFVGDDKQLAPYGQDEIRDLQSIFELGPHRSRALMLDQCYRLPTPICAFISHHMYDDMLKSVHVIKTRRSCKFVDVRDGAEVEVSRSWTNQLEADTCIALVKQLYKTGRRDFKIITPYDAQRKVLEDKLKATDVPWQDSVFCVDSFQGHEAEYIVISIVRTKKPGFMTNARRTNVMLTRCMKGMYICAQRAFLQSPAAQQTLVGKMAKEWADGWISSTDVLNGRI